MGSKIVIHDKTDNRKSWDQHIRDGSNASLALRHYRCFLVIDSKTKSLIISDTVGFLHSYIPHPTLRHEDKVTHAINNLTCAPKYAPVITIQAKLENIDNVH